METVHVFNAQLIPRVPNNVIGVKLKRNGVVMFNAVNLTCSGIT